MSALNGDRARFNKDRKRKLLHRQHIQALAMRLQKRIEEPAPAAAASRRMHDKGGPLRTSS